MYLVDMKSERSASEAEYITAKSLVGIGREFYQTAAQVGVQAAAERDEVAVATGVAFASISLEGAMSTRYTVSPPS
jgi:hypothetical protein